MIEKAKYKNVSIKNNPWKIKNQGINTKSIKFWIRYLFFIIYIRLRMLVSALFKSFEK